MQKIRLFAWIPAAIVAGCAAPPASSVPPDVLAGWNTAADCLRVQRKAGDIAGGGAAGDVTATRPGALGTDAETRFLAAQYAGSRPDGTFGRAGFKDGWFATCRRYIGDR